MCLDPPLPDVTPDNLRIIAHEECPGLIRRLRAGRRHTPARFANAMRANLGSVYNKLKLCNLLHVNMINTGSDHRTGRLSV